MIYGGLAVIQHRQLRQWLVEKQLAPPDYVAFLDYAAERNLMRKVGGGYMFVHLLLQDYFKDLGEVE